MSSGFLIHRRVGDYMHLHSKVVIYSKDYGFLLNISLGNSIVNNLVCLRLHGLVIVTENDYIYTDTFNLLLFIFKNILLLPKLFYFVIKFIII